MEAVRVIRETDSYLIAWKPPGLHSAPLRKGESGTLLSMILEKYPEVSAVPGLKPVEPGLLHRLDRETSGFVLIARTREAWDFFCEEARSSRFMKRYSAVCIDLRSEPELRSLSEVPGWPFTGMLVKSEGGKYPEAGDRIVSGFRAYGPGRQRTAPVEHTGKEAAVPSGKRLPEGRAYETKILGEERLPSAVHGFPLVRFRIELAQGFRHQIRCHLAACGLPIAGDSLYSSPVSASSFSRMHLYADGMSFRSLETGEMVRFDEEATVSLP